MTQEAPATVTAVSSGRSSAGEISLVRAFAYAAPSAGGFFFYVPMWSILPGMYSKHFGLPLATVAMVVLTLRLFDGAIIPLIGYLSDRHHARGGSRKPWIVSGYLGVIIACFFLFQPPQPAPASYYLIWSLVYFVSFMLADIPHVTWGNELTLEYQARARVFGIRTFLSSVGSISFYSLPLWPIFASSDYTPEVLGVAVYIGIAMLAVGMVWMLLAAPAGKVVRTTPHDSARLFLRSLRENRPLQIYFSAFALTGVCYGMWFGLVYFYLDTYLGHGGKVAIIFMLSDATTTAAMPLLLKLIGKTSKSTAWALGIAFFILQLIGAAWLTPGHAWWVSLALVMTAHLCFSCHNVAALSILGDIADYGKLKFHQDRTATYFGVNSLVFQVAVGLGGGLALTIAGHFGFEPAAAAHTSREVFGLKLGFTAVPLLLALLALPFIVRTPINRRRHRTIQRRLESRLIDAVQGRPVVARGLCVPSDSAIR